MFLSCRIESQGRFCDSAGPAVESLEFLKGHSPLMGATDRGLAATSVAGGGGGGGGAQEKKIIEVAALVLNTCPMQYPSNHICNRSENFQCGT